MRLLLPGVEVLAPWPSWPWARGRPHRPWLRLTGTSAERGGLVGLHVDEPEEGAHLLAVLEHAERVLEVVGGSPADQHRTRASGVDEFLVEGKLEKPSAYYILRRSSLDYDWARLDAKFSPLVLESVQDPLF